jgi:hypothetical protein
MKSIIIGGVIVLSSVMAPQIIQAQGTMTCLSNLGQASAGSLAVGSDSWLAVGFGTGNNVSGYTLDSIQLGMADASGNPSGFAVMLYSSNIGGGVIPRSSLGTLDGSLSPVVGGIFTYAPASSLTLSPNSDYFIVLTAGTTVANGAYDWSYANTYSYSQSGGWVAPLEGGAIDNYQSSDGSNWNFVGGPDQFAITVTDAPEPGILGLLGLGGLAFLWHRRRF